MRRKLFTGVAALAWVSGVAVAETHTMQCQTDRHNIQITCYSEESCIYQSWNKPKQIGQGIPDLEIRQGSLTDTHEAFQSGNACASRLYAFEQEVDADAITLQYGIHGKDRECFPKGVPEGAKGELVLYFDHAETGRYWVY